MTVAIPTTVSLLIFSLLALVGVSLCSARTFLGDGGYVRHDAWNLNPQRLLRFTFQTSERNGLLLYAPEPTNGSSSPPQGEDHMLIRLVNGSLLLNVNLGPINSEEERFGEFLNDNQAHTLTIFHDAPLSRFQYTLDGLLQQDETYASHLNPVFGTNGIFIGGVPSNATPFANDTRFTGCLRDVLFASSDGLGITNASSSLQSLPVAETGGTVADVCVDPCARIQCGSGECVPKWPDNAFCNCRNSLQLGEFCNETDRSAHPLNLALPSSEKDTTHYCYHPVLEPYSGPSNFFTVQLLPPIPSEGVIFVGHVENGDSFFSIRLEKNRIVFEYDITVGVSSFNITMNTVLESDGTTYQVDLTAAFNHAELVLSSVTEDGGGGAGGVTELERSDTSGRSNVLIYPETTLFSLVCLGGSLLDFENYIGTLQSSFFNFNSLLEERTSSVLQAEGVARSDTIVFADSLTPRSLRFTRFTLRNNFTFQVRHPQERPRGVLFHIEDGLYDFLFTTFDSITFFGRFTNLTTNRTIALAFDLCSGPPGTRANDEEWHSYQVLTNLNPLEGENPSISVIYDDGVFVCLYNKPEYRIPIFSLAEAPLQFGTTHNFLENEEQIPATFRGCMTGFEFQKENGAPGVFRPNLEAVPRFDPLFNATGCYHCVAKLEPEPGLCGINGEVCTDLGYGREGECVCPLGLTCQEPPITTTTTTIITAATTSTDTTSTDITTATTTTTTTSTEPSQSPSPNLGRSIGIGLGLGVALLMIIALVVLLISCIVYRKGSKIRGFYQTNESNGQESSMIRYSASLRQLSSEIVSSDKDNTEVSWSHKNGHHINGGIAPTRTRNNDKEFYL